MGASWDVDDDLDVGRAGVEVDVERYIISTISS
jgi:hypothetical protein